MKSPRPPTESPPRRRAWTWGAVGVGVPLLVYLAVVAAGYDGGPVLRGDGYYYVSTAISLWQDHDLALENQLPGDLAVHSNHVSLDRRGRLVPKHPIVLPLASLPLVISFREAGAVAFNLTALVGIAVLLYVLALRWVPPWAAAAAVAATGTLTILPHYAWIYSGDLPAVVLVLAGLVALPRGDRAESARWRLALAGFFFGLGVFAKLPMALAAALGFLLLPSPRWRCGRFYLAGLVVPLMALALLQFHLFGHPLVTSYDRIAVKSEGVWETVSQRDDFDLPAGEGMKRQLVDRRYGLLPTSPITLLSYALLPLLWRRDQRMSFFCGIVALGFFLFFSRYTYWYMSHHGNRFLMLPMALGALPLAVGVEELGSWLRARGRGIDRHAIR